MKKPNRKLSAAQRRKRRERQREFMTIFINGRKKRVPRPPLTDGIPTDEFIAKFADPIWLHQNGIWELMTSDEAEEGFPQQTHARPSSGIDD